jgi:hypothetical protein
MLQFASGDGRMVLQTVKPYGGEVAMSNDPFGKNPYDPEGRFEPSEPASRPGRQPAPGQSEPAGEYSPRAEELSPEEAAKLQALAAQEELAIQMQVLDQRGRSGAGWFYWVAGLSLVNSAIAHFGGGLFFVVGLGITLVVDTAATEFAQQQPNLATALKTMAIGFDVFIVLVVIGFGWLAQRRFLAIYAIGMFLYLLDGLLFLLFQDFLSVAFHAFAL